MTKSLFLKFITLHLFFLIFNHKVCLGFQQQSGNLLSKSDTAFVPKEIEDPECIGINREHSHATLMPYASLKEALVAKRRGSSFSLSLNGIWKFNWVDWPQKRPLNFYKTSYDVSGWKDIKVPSCWQMQGYAIPICTNITYPFKKDFPRVMSTPSEKYTAFKARDEVVNYRRDFTLTAEWKGRRIFISFDGVNVGFFIWVNGQKVVSTRVTKNINSESI